MKKIYLSLLFLILAALFYSCTGAPGAPGINAADGASVMILQNGVSPYSSWAGISDTEIISGGPTYNHGDCDTMHAGYYNSVGSYIMRSLIKVDLSVIDPQDVTIVDAYLKFYVSAIAGTTTLTAYAVTTNWQQGTGPCGTGTTTDATWNRSATGLNWTSSGADFSATPASDTIEINTAGFFVLKLNTAVVQSWITSPAQNFGILLKGANETPSFNQINITTSEVNSEYGPKFTVYYRLP